MQIRIPINFEEYLTGTSLNLNDKGITADDIPELLVFLKKNQITSLHLDRCAIKNEGAILLAKNSTVTTLSVCDNGIKSEGALAIAKNTCLKVLNISGNDIGETSAIAFGENSTLLELSVSRCYIGDDSATAIAKSKSLYQLDISNNYIGMVGAVAFADNQTIAILNITHNCIINSSALAFAKALIKNQSIIKLNMEGNAILGTHDFINEISKNQTILEITMNLDCDQLEKFLRRNRENLLDYQLGLCRILKSVTPKPHCNLIENYIGHTPPVLERKKLEARIELLEKASLISEDPIPQHQNSEIPAPEKKLTVGGHSIFTKREQDFPELSFEHKRCFSI